MAFAAGIAVRLDPGAPERRPAIRPWPNTGQPPAADPAMNRPRIALRMVAAPGGARRHNGNPSVSCAPAAAGHRLRFVGPAFAPVPSAITRIEQYPFSARPPPVA